MTKRHFINYFQKKINLKKKSKIIFSTEYLLKSFSPNQLKSFNYEYLENLNHVYNKNKKKLFILKKVSQYRNFLKNKLNKIHNTKFKSKEWGLLLDYYLIVSIISINRKIESYKKLKDKKISIEVISGNFFFSDTKSIYDQLAHGIKLNQYIDYIIFDKLKFKNLNIRKIKFADKSYEKQKKTNLLNKFFLNIIIKIFKPSLIFNGYFGIVKSIKIMCLSKFKILFLKDNFLNSPVKLNYKNIQLREMLDIPEKDFFDKVFNVYNKNIFPNSFLESFDHFYYSNKKLSKDAKNVGTAILLHISDTFKFLLLNIKKSGGKIITFQHGGLFGMRKFSPEDYINNNYADLKFLWADKKGIGAPYFNKVTKINDKKSGILFLPSLTLFQEMTENLKECNHLYLNKYWKLYEFINIDKKKLIKFKLFNHPRSKILKNLWLRKTNKSIKFEYRNYKGNIAKKFKLTVIDNFSTPLFELIYNSYPFIIINDSKQNEFTNEFKKILNHLKSLNILFDSEKKAADFINKNYNDIDSWWNKIIKKKKFKIIKKSLFSIKEFNNSKFVNSFAQQLAKGDNKIS